MANKILQLVKCCYRFNCGREQLPPGLCQAPGYTPESAGAAHNSSGDDGVGVSSQSDGRFTLGKLVTYVLDRLREADSRGQPDSV